MRGSSAHVQLWETTHLNSGLPIVRPPRRRPGPDRRTVMVAGAITAVVIGAAGALAWPSSTAETTGASAAATTTAEAKGPAAGLNLARKPAASPTECLILGSPPENTAAMTVLFVAAGYAPANSPIPASPAAAQRVREIAAQAAKPQQTCPDLMPGAAPGTFTVTVPLARGGSVLAQLRTGRAPGRGTPVIVTAVAELPNSTPKKN